MHMLIIDRGFSEIPLACDVSQLAGPSWEAVAELSWLYDTSVVVAVGLPSEDAPLAWFDGWTFAPSVRFCNITPHGGPPLGGALGAR